MPNWILPDWSIKSYCIHHVSPDFRQALLLVMFLRICRTAFKKEKRVLNQKDDSPSCNVPHQEGRDIQQHRKLLNTARTPQHIRHRALTEAIFWFREVIAGFLKQAHSYAVF